MGIELMWMQAGRLQDRVKNEGGRYGREPLWRECVQRAGELLAPGWSPAGSCVEEGAAFDVLTMLIYALSPSEGRWMPRQVPIERLIEALELRDGDGGEVRIREGLAWLGHDPEDESDWCVSTLNAMTRVQHREYFEPAMGTWDSYPSEMVPFFGSWTTFQQGAELAQRWLKAFHGPDRPDILRRYPVLAASEVSDLQRMLRRLADDDAGADPELRAEAQRLADIVQLRCRELSLPI